MFGWLRRVQTRIELNCERMGLSYPWWIPAYSTLAYLILDVIAYAQRGAVTAAWPVTVAALAVPVPTVLWSRGILVQPWLKSLFTLGAFALFLVQPVTVDFAPLLLMILAGEVAATATIRTTTVVSTIEVSALITAMALHRIDSGSLYIVGVVLGVDVGIALRWQMRALSAERANGAMRAEQAMLAERQRIAREIHDVVGHTLSINLLHVTAARHALQRHADIDDAVESLVEAEQVGRQAMNDLRRTVNVLTAGPSAAYALPTAADLPELIERSRAAGLDVRYTCSGSLAAIEPATGLGVYRIVQESLANIAKHAPDGPASVHVSADGAELTVCVRNPLPNRPATNTGGTGLPGMAARAEQLGAQLRTGADGTDWAVEFALPLSDAARPAAVEA